MTGATGDDRRERLWAAMDGRGLDVLVLGRQGNTTWATGMHRLWTAGTRPFGAGCVLVGETRGVHLLSSWDDGIPDDVPFEQLYGVTWSPVVMAEAMAAIPGLADAARIGVDALSPGFRRAAGGFAPVAELVAADDLMADLRRPKSDSERSAIARACGVATAAVDAVIAAVAAGDDDPGRLRGIGLVTAAGAGGTVPSSGITVDRGAATVCVDVGVLLDDWEGGLGRTVSLDGQARGGRIEERVQALMAVCRAGATGAEIQRCGGDGGWSVRGVGMGFERPVVGPTVGTDVELVIGDVLSISASGDDRHHREMIVVTDGRAEPLR